MTFDEFTEFDKVLKSWMVTQDSLVLAIEKFQDEVVKLKCYYYVYPMVT